MHKKTFFISPGKYGDMKNVIVVTWRATSVRISYFLTTTFLPLTT